MARQHAAGRRTAGPDRYLRPVSRFLSAAQGRSAPGNLSHCSVGCDSPYWRGSVCRGAFTHSPSSPEKCLSKPIRGPQPCCRSLAGVISSERMTGRRLFSFRRSWAGGRPPDLIAIEANPNARSWETGERQSERIKQDVSRLAAEIGPRSIYHYDALQKAAAHIETS